jgi:hypothetical protein
VSGNPGGVPKHDYAKEIAKAIFENNPEMVYKAFLKALSKGSAYAYQVLADRAYGKLKEHHAVEVGPYRDMTAQELLAQIQQKESALGITPSASEEEVQERISKLRDQLLPAHSDKPIN